MTTSAALHITGLLLGGFLSVIFVGYMILSFSEGRRRESVTTPQRFAGMVALALGFVMLGAWGYLLAMGWASFWERPAELSIHVLTELISSVTLIVAGFAMLRAWSRGPALFMIANGFLLFTAVLALSAYGMSGHPFLMNGITILLVIASVYLVGLVYGWEHFVLRLDEKQPRSQGKSGA